MDLSKLTYTKGASIRLPKDFVRATPTVKGRGDKPFELPDAASAYQKPDGILSLNLVFVLSGGEKKEKDFLRELIRQRE